ncbi:hypothetical protein [Natrinema ejinorense]|nr:hypothetical protein [Natrinema ejinorense]
MAVDPKRDRRSTKSVAASLVPDIDAGRAHHQRFVRDCTTRHA